MAWLNSTPKDCDKKRREKIDLNDEDYGLPEIEDYLVSILSEIGEAEVGNDLKPIGWDQIMAYQIATESYLTPGECVALRYLSGCYVNQYYMSNNENVDPPNIIETNRDKVAKKVKSLFGMIR